MANIIKNISSNQFEILYNIMQLYNDGKPFECDMTYSSGKFYDRGGEFAIPQPSLKFDVMPQFDDVVKIEPWGKLPLDDNSLSSMVIDLPFIIAPRNSPSCMAENEKDGSNIIFKRFSSYYPALELYQSYWHWLEETYRVLRPDGLCVFKCQDNVSGGKFHNVSSFSFMVAHKLGFTIEDKFILEAKSRLISGKVKKQMHARNYTSVFWVIIKNNKFKLDYIDLLNAYSNQIFEKFN